MSPKWAPGEAQKGLPEAQNEPPEAPGANVIKMSLPKCPPARQYSTFGAKKHKSAELSRFFERKPSNPSVWLHF